MQILRPLFLCLMLVPLQACFDLYTRSADSPLTPDSSTDMSSASQSDGAMSDMADPLFVQKKYVPDIRNRESLAAISTDTNVIVTSSQIGSEIYIKCYRNKPDSTEWKDSCTFDGEMMIQVNTDSNSGFLAAFLPNGLLLVARKKSAIGNREYNLELYSTKEISNGRLVRVKEVSSALKYPSSTVSAIRLSSDAQKIFVETYSASDMGTESQVVSLNTPQAAP